MISETDFTVPSFNGSSYLQYPGFAAKLNLYFDIEVTFKPRAPSGVILYNGHKMDGAGDFLSLNLVEGFVEFRFNPGNGPAVIRSLYPVTMDQWHVIRVSRTARLGTLQVDDQPEVGGYSMGAFSQLSLPLNLFVGGVSDMKDVSRDSGVTHAFVGCVQKVVVNGRRLMLLEEALSGVNVADCESALNVTSANVRSSNVTRSKGSKSSKRREKCTRANAKYSSKCAKQRPVYEEQSEPQFDEMYVKAVLHDT